MKLYPENYDVALDFLFTDLNGTPVTPTGVSAVLYDGDDVEIADFGSMPFDVADGKKTVTVAAALNVLGAGELSAVRILRVALVTPAGTIRRSASYIIEGEQRLEVLNNTFISLEAADALSRDVPNLHGWSGADDESRGAALINAYARLSRIQLKFTVEDPTLTDYQCDRVLNPSTWPDVTKADFNQFPKRFRDALRLAQLVEANAILTDNPIEQRHRAGVISETVGESSIMLRGNRLDLSVSAEALRYLKGYVYFNVRIGRA